MTNEHYTNVERALLQYAMSLGVVSEEKLILFHAKSKELIKQKDDQDEQEAIAQERSLDHAIDLINQKLYPLDYKIAKVLNQEKGDSYYVYCNTSEDKPSTAATQFTTAEIDVIKKLIDFIITEGGINESYVIGSSNAIKKVSSSITSYTASQSQQFLDKLVNSGWFNLSQNGKYSLSLKTLTELKSTLIEKYSKREEGGLIDICLGCKDIVTVGVRCPNQTCHIRLHEACENNYSRARRDQGRVCPCGNDWSENDLLPVGESVLRGL
ncbi:hypothetical protein WICMUC_000698 [Wickerhamomyces mucosus]|uniref:Non-structural maintenance of chromosomes element 1 homolog n=1 Tax=Wickerhamomyces mucosus TaxID=1378264 RepID=A0A9P8TIK1_9ASCO|nr:hypothetical protein WICMUC_000698 [Wickerhamomyces mucosus]